MRPIWIGPIIVLLGMIYTHVATRFFGSHFLPATPEEVITDGIGVIILSIGMAVTAICDAIGKGKK
jgi:hypothetical protein